MRNFLISIRKLSFPFVQLSECLEKRNMSQECDNVDFKKIVGFVTHIQFKVSSEITAFWEIMLTKPNEYILVIIDLTCVYYLHNSNKFIQEVSPYIYILFFRK